MDSKLYDAMLQIFDGGGRRAGSQAGPDSSQPGTGETEVLYGKQQDTGSDRSAQEETTEETTETPEERGSLPQLIRASLRISTQRTHSGSLTKRSAKTKRSEIRCSSKAAYWIP